MSVPAAGKPSQDSRPRGRAHEKVMLRAIVFDFDGVIANSEPLHFQAFRDVLSAHGLAFDERDYYARYLGFDDVGVFQAVGAEQRAGWTSARIGELVADKAVRLEALE